MQYQPQDLDHETIEIPNEVILEDPEFIADHVLAHVVDRTEVQKRTLAHVVNADAMTPGERAINDGVIRLRASTNITALAALEVGESNDHEICMVISVLGLYVYVHGDSTLPVLNVIIASADNTGRWKRLS